MPSPLAEESLSAICNTGPWQNTEPGKGCRTDERWITKGGGSCLCIQLIGSDLRRRHLERPFRHGRGTSAAQSA